VCPGASALTPLGPGATHLLMATSPPESRSAKSSRPDQIQSTSG